MSSSFRKTVEKLDEQAGDRMPCLWCKAPTATAILNKYGARCFVCYEVFCRKQQFAPEVGDKRVDGPRAWAYALKAREEAGEQLGSAQRAMWRSALSAALNRAKDGQDVSVRDITEALQASGDLLPLRKPIPLPRPRSSFDEPAWFAEMDPR